MKMMQFDSYFIQYNAIGDRGAVALASALQLNNSISALDIAVCGAKGKTLGGAFSLILTCMQFNNIGEDGAVALAMALEHNSCITTFKLPVC